MVKTRVLDEMNNIFYIMETLAGDVERSFSLSVRRRCEQSLVAGSWTTKYKQSGGALGDIKMKFWISIYSDVKDHSFKWKMK